MRSLNFGLLSEEEVEVEIPEGGILEVVPDEQLDDHAPDESDDIAIAEIGEVAEGLESLRSQIENMAAAGSINADVSKLIGISVALAERNARGKGTFNQAIAAANEGEGNFGLESFNNKSSSAAYASYAMLGIGSTISSIVKRIMEFCRKWFNKAATWWNKILSGAAFAKRKAQSVIADAKKLTESATGTIEMGPTEHNSLSVEGVFKPKEAVALNLAAIKGLKPGELKGKLEDIYNGVAKISFETKKDVKNATKGLILSEAGKKQVQALPKIESWYKSAKEYLGFGDAPDPKSKDTATKKSLKKSNLSGNQEVVLEFEGVEIEGSVYLKRITAHIEARANGKNADTTQTAPILTKSEIEAIGEVCVNAANALISAKNEYREAMQLIGDVESKLKEVAKKLEGGPIAAGHEDVARLITGVVTSAASTITAPYTVSKLVQNITLTSVNSALNYCRKSINKHTA